MFSVWIDGVKYVVEKPSINIDKRVEERSTASFTIMDEAGVLDFVRGQPVEILQPWALPPFHLNEFSGFIDTPGRVKIAPNSDILYHDISCMDNHYLADKRLVVKSYSDKTAGFIVDDILTDYLADEGVVEGEIQTGPVIAEPIFNYGTASECLDALQELTGFTWFIDETKQLYFIDRETNLAAWNLDGVIHGAIKDSVYLSTGNPLYRNMQYVRGGTGVTALQTEDFTGDGVTVAFTVGYPIAQTPAVEVNAVVQTVGIKGIDSGYDCYWNKGDATITFEVAPGAVNVEIEYYGQYPLISMAVSGDVANRAAIEGTSGIVEEMTTEAQHESSDSINASAQGKIKQYCQGAERFSYQTYESGLSPGQLQEITYSPFGFAAHKMLIESVNIMTNGEDVRYNIICITGPSIGSWARFFSNILRRQDASIKIGDSLLLVLLQQSEVLELSEVVSIDENEFAVSGNVNRWLNSAPIDAGSLYNIQHERLEMAEVGSESHHLTEDYTWEVYTGDTLWDFFTWG